MTMKDIRWGIIGTGAITGRFRQGMEQVPDASITAVWGRNPVTTAQVAAAANARACTSVEELFAQEIDAVYVATLPDTHAHYSIAALNAGKHVLCEKPVALNLRELDEVLAVARARGLLFMEGMKPPFFPVYRRLMEHLERDPIGQVGFVRSGFAKRSPQTHEAWRLQTGGGGLMGIGVYHAFLAAKWLGAATDWHTLGIRGEEGVDTFAAMLLQHEGGISQIFCGIDTFTPGDAVLAGELGHVLLHEPWWNPERISVVYEDGRRVDLHEPFTASGLWYEVAHFCDLVREGRLESPVIPHSVSRDVMSILDRGRASLGVVFPGDGPEA